MVSTRMSRDLPDYRAVIAADIKDFTGNTGTGYRMLAQRLPQVLSEAFARSGLDFSRARFPARLAIAMPPVSTPASSPA